MSGYKKSGVDTGAADKWVSFIEGTLKHKGKPSLSKNLVSGVGAYAAVYALDKKRWLATTCDGVGTKLLWTQEGMGRSADLAQDLFAMNVNDLICVGASPLLFLDYLAVGSKKILSPKGSMGSFLKGLNEACLDSHCLLVGGETAQMPDIYEKDGYDMAGFAVGTLEPEDFLSIERVDPRRGADLWAWPSSGPHSNGFSWLRKLFSSKSDKNFIKKNLMVPTKIYVKDFLNLKSTLSRTRLSKELLSAFHVTGSGLLNLVRAAHPAGHLRYNLHSWDETRWPSWAEEVAKRSKATKEELYTTFNMGLGLILLFSKNNRERLRPLLESVGLINIGELSVETGANKPATKASTVRVDGISFS